MHTHRPFVGGLVALITILSTAEGSAAQPATPQEVADFWETIFAGSSPYGLPPVNGTRTNQRSTSGVTLWDVRFDSYRDPTTNLPLSLGGVFAVPSGTSGPGPGGTFPGLVVTHSVGVSSPAPDNVADMATFFAQRGYATLAFFMRGWGTSQMANNRVDNNDLFTQGLVPDGAMPLDNDFAGMAADSFQAGEFLATQAEVWDPNQLSFIGHSGGGYAAMAAGIFSNRFAIISASAPANAAQDPNAWLDYWQPAGVMSWIAGQTDPTEARSLIVRMLSFTGIQPAIDNAALVSKNAAWRLDGSALFLYGGELDPSVDPADVQAIYAAADPTTPTLKAFHWSPTGGHGGPESWDRAQAWLAGHYPQGSTTAPTAALATAAVSGTTIDLTAAGSTAWAFDWSYDAGSLGSDAADIVSWVYDFGDSTAQNWGPSVSHTFASAGTYDVTLTVTDGAGRRAATTQGVTVGGVASAQLDISRADPVIVPEGGQATVDVRLTAAPAAPLSVTLARDTGDADLSVAPTSLGFSSANWDVWHNVTLSAAQDPDGISSPAVFSVSAPGMVTVLINAREDDDDATFSMSAGAVVGIAGTQVVVPVTLSNAGAAVIDSFGFQAAFDSTVMLSPTATAGSDLPGAAWWNFSYSTPTAGMLAVTASEWVAPAEPAIAGEVALIVVQIAPSAAVGSYPITLSTTSVNGSLPGLVEAGEVSVVDALVDGGPSDGGGGGDDGPAADGGITTDGGSTADGGATTSGDSDNTSGDTAAGQPGSGSASGGCSCRGTSSAGWLSVLAMVAIWRRRRSAEGSRKHAVDQLL